MIEISFHPSAELDQAFTRLLTVWRSEDIIQMKTRKKMPSVFLNKILGYGLMIVLLKMVFNTSSPSMVKNKLNI
jgi:hypothetical protein